MKNLGESPFMRMLATIVMIAASIRLVYWLLAPVWPYLLATAVITAVFLIVRWHRSRW